MSEQSTSEALGEGQDTTVEVSRLVSKPLKSLWMALMTTEGAEALLGKGGQIPDKGYSWRSAGGAHGVIRSFHPLEQIRFSWHADDNAPATLVDLRMYSEDEETSKIQISHKNLPPEADREAIKARWERAFDRILAAIG